MKCIKSKRIVQCILFLLILAGIFVFLNYLLKSVTINRKNIMGYYEQEDELDMVYVGSSGTYLYFAPMLAWDEHGMASYNFAYNSMPAESIIYATKEVFKYQSPSLLLVDLRPFQYRDEDDGLREMDIRNYSDNVKYSKERTEFLESVVPDHVREGYNNNLLEYKFDFLKNHDTWPYLNWESFQSVTNRMENKLRGFEMIAKVDGTLQYVDNRAIDEIKEPSEYVQGLFAEYIEYCKTLDCQILFVVSSEVETKEKRLYYNYFAGEIEAAGMGYLNVNDYIEETMLDYSRDLYNNNHVNILGAEKYTRFLTNYIKEHYELPDRRGQEGYEDWDEDLMYWEEELAIYKEQMENLL